MTIFLFSAAQQEQWRPVPSIPRLMASSHGRLMLQQEVKPMPNGSRRVYGGTPTRGNWDGERFLYSKKGKTYKVARLVCEAFNGSPPPGAVCMHMDENSRNNRPENLQWGTQKQNLNAPKFLEYCRSRIGESSPYRKGMQRSARA